MGNGMDKVSCVLFSSLNFNLISKEIANFYKNLITNEARSLCNSGAARLVRWQLSGFKRSTTIR